MRLFKRLGYLLLAGFFSFLLYATYPAWSSMFASTPTTFTPENWRDAHPYHRELMANDFIARYPVVGMRREEVVKLLGKPDTQSSGYMDYMVAITTADYMALTIEIDSSGRIIRAYLRQT